ncbi:endonuclease MutS2 [Thermosipho atlanticus]|uniref:Endonuclease MutS2 n=1 Tax=Thermosipho atlanticus DSM 15807 TaxID=1123380 RepID=A0A1M5SHL8_9BACT|nr:endonuclease MutS2 [Thermosipho atlanticus]SHH37989.1 DNA mismatch repair protein MutS2 [Thermosipho atlanticus DSM 15807]
MEIVKYIDWELIFEEFKKLTFSNYGKEHLETLVNVKPNDLEYDYLQEILEILVSFGLPSFPKIFDIRPILEKIKNNSILNVDEIYQLRNFFLTVEDIKKNFKSTRYKFSFYISNLSNYSLLLNEIDRIFDENGKIKDSASTTLLNIRKNIKNLHLEIRKKIDSFATKNSNYLQDQIYTIRNDRYVFLLKSNARSKFQGVVHGSSSSGATLFFEPQEFIYLNDRIQILKSEEKIEIDKILRGLTTKIYEKYNNIMKDIKIVGHFDSLLARAKYAKNNKGIVVKPDGNYLKLVNARHPLIEKEKVVPITIDLPQDKKGLIITGPNTGGKTVTLKTISLFVFMAQKAFPILAETGTRIPNLKLFLDIGDAQNVVENLSTFSSHILRIVHALKNADENSLVIIDELGSGTDPFEGSALALSIIEELLEKNTKFIITTHLTSVKLYAMEHNEILTASMEFDIDTLKPTYKVLLNTPGASHAFEISKKLGLSDKIINRAERFLSQDHLKIENLIKSLNSKVSELEKKKEALEKLLKEYEILKENYEKKYNILKVKKIEELDDEIKSLYKEIRSAKKHLQLAMHSIKTKSENLLKKRLKILEKTQNNFKKLEDVIDELKNPSPPEELHVGMYVKLKDGTAIGKIIEQRSENKFLVDFNGLKVEIKKNKLVPTTPPTEDIFQPTIIPSKILDKNEIDLRGKTVEEALELLDKFIDDLILSDFKYGYIIHGKGTGSLASNVWNYLRKDDRVKNYRFGRPSEGGIGVTYIEV